MTVTVRTNGIMVARYSNTEGHWFLQGILPKCTNVPAKEPEKHTCYMVNEDLVLKVNEDFKLFIWAGDTLTVEQ